ncbi:MAG TPA: LPS assembly protein LptD [Mariprofundaceae bacterium]|nr:LPS assembly protein LptD [Mariprofundaceae bacterium]
MAVTARALGLLLGLTALASPAWAAGIDIAADRITRDAQGVLVAEGHVVIQRGSETLHADMVHYDVQNHLIRAEGHVLITSPRGQIDAAAASLHTDSETGSMQDATLTLPDGERLYAKQVRRLDATTFEAESIRFTACPSDDEAWQLAAHDARLDQKKGELVARGTRFEIAGIPVLYSPYWRQPLRRQSGFLTPLVASGKRRGTEVALPYYLAPSPDWDATFTPHWMSGRGFMPELELRHASGIGTAQVNGEVINDRTTKTRRGRIQGDIDWRLPARTFLTVRADHISDRNYLPDYDTSNQLNAPYLQSEAALVGLGNYGDWMLMGRDQQDLTQPNDAATLQIAPRLESHLAAPLARNLWLHFDQQTTRFERQLGLYGWRMDLNPYIELPWQLAGGGLEITARAGSHVTRYWLQQAATPSSTMQRSAGEASLEIRSTFERISADRTWRHTIEPVLRYDYIRAPSDQSGLPNFDSSFGQLTMSNLLSGNRFSGNDRIERANRVTALLQSRLQHRGEAGAPARDVMLIAIGSSYDIRRSSVDPALKPIPATHWSNLLGSLMISPIAGLSLHGEGQYSTRPKFWATANAGLDWVSAGGHELHLGYQFTDARFATATRLFSASARLAVTPRWQMLGGIQYDSLLRLTQQASVGLRYQHPCWSLEVDGYRYNRPSGTTPGSDIGFRFLLGLRGLGSVGS